MLNKFSITKAADGSLADFSNSFAKIYVFFRTGNGNLINVPNKCVFIQSWKTTLEKNLCMKVKVWRFYNLFTI
jgi:hypothetical protein